MKKFLLITFPSHPHSQNYTLSPDSRTVSQGHFQRSNQHFIADFFLQTDTSYCCSIWGKLQKLGCHCLYFLSALFRKPDIVDLKLLECKASTLTLSEGRTCPGSCLCQQEGPAIPSFPPLLTSPAISGSGRILPSRICNQQYRNALKDTNTDKVRFPFP